MSERSSTIGAPRSRGASYRRYAHWFRARLTRKYGAQEADDLSQEAWLRFTPYEAANEVSHPKALLMKIASNLALDQRARRVTGAALETEIQARSQWAVELPTQQNELLAKQIVLSLPQPLRDVFVLSRVGGLSNSQIAETLGISVKTVEKRMTKALAHCAAQLRL